MTDGYCFGWGAPVPCVGNSCGELREIGYPTDSTYKTCIYFREKKEKEKENAED